MPSVSRTAQFARIHKILKKYYKPVLPPADRSVLEHLLFACCLEDARYDAAEEAFAGLVHTFFDWNEVRVTSLSELSEVLAALPDPRVAAHRIKRVLHGLFEDLYCFDLEEKRKKPLGVTIKWLEKIEGMTRFAVAYVVQSALGGHWLPLDYGTLAAFRVLDLLSDKDAVAGAVPGLERAVSKSKGIEFGSLAHQLGADFLANPFSPQVREVLLQIDPGAAERFPKRRIPPPPPPVEKKTAAEKHAEKKPGAEKPADKKSAAEKPADKKGAAEKPAEKKPATEKAGEKTAAERPADKKSAAEKLAEKKPAAEKAVERPVGEKHSEKKPAAEKAVEKTVGEKHSEKKPAAEKAVEKPVGEKEPAGPAAEPAARVRVHKKKAEPPASEAPPAAAAAAPPPAAAKPPAEPVKPPTAAPRKKPATSDSHSELSASEGLAKRKPR
ncbi:MAG: hypothetical protein ABSF26_18815 [Thermoguttaceae bacterium]|jgi:endonuclease-3